MKNKKVATKLFFQISAEMERFLRCDFGSNDGLYGKGGATRARLKIAEWRVRFEKKDYLDFLFYRRGA